MARKPKLQNLKPANSESVGFLYINGLGNGNTTPKDHLVRWWWKRAGFEIHHAHINWYDGGNLKEKTHRVESQVNEMLKIFGGVAIIGSSAGASLALNAFHRLKDKNVCAVTAHGRIRRGNYSDNHRLSLHRRAHLDTDRPSLSFLESVDQVETQTIPDLSIEDKKRVLVLTQTTDMVVPLNLMHIEGVKTHRSFAFGHSGGFLAHLLADRNIIAGFAQEVLA